MGQLNELQIKAAQPRDKEYMLSDGEAAQHAFQYAVDVGALEPAKSFVNSRTGGLRAPRALHYAAINDPLKLG